MTLMDEIKRTLANAEAAPGDLLSIQKTAEENITAYGEPSATKEQAAAYGAGCLVIALALGLKSDVVLMQTPNSNPPTWKAEAKLELRTLEECYTEQADIKDVVKSAMQCLAGFCGEMVKELGHPNSALPLRLKGTMYASYLDYVYAMVPGTYFTRILDLVHGVLIYNSVTLDELYSRLLAEESISLDNPDAKVPLVNLNQIFGSIQ